ncbi:MAG: hypothetical protein U0X34_10190 [Bacteroidia bacterium]
MAITVYTATRKSIQLEEQPLAAAGGEGSVHRVKSTPGFPNHCAKIYHHPKRNLLRKQKVEFMVQNKPSILSTTSYIICFPIEIIYDHKSNFVGFIMPLAFNGSEKLYELTTAKVAPRLQLHWSKFERTSKSGIERRLKVCVNIAQAIHDIHITNKYTIVDLKPQNILITNEGKISITDVDSFQISRNGNVLHFSEVTTPEYAPPESNRLNPSKDLIPENWDRFSLAVSFYEILFGIHPFTSTCDGQYESVTTIGEKIQKGLFVHGSKKIYLTVIPSIHNNFFNLPTSIRNLFIKAFEDGHTNPASRPSAEDWGKTIYTELNRNIGIKANTTTISQRRAATATGKSLGYKQASTNVKAAQLRKSVGITKAKKEDDMFWKVLTFILAVLVYGFYMNSRSYESELRKLKDQILLSESKNTNLQNQLTQLENYQTSKDTTLNSRISDLENSIYAIGQKYPITVNEIKYNNVTGDSDILNLELSEFNKSELQYIQPVIKFNSNLRTETVITVYYKIFAPDGKLLSGINSPNGYTWYGEIYIPGYFAKGNSKILNPFSVSCPYYCGTGKYNVEIWSNGLMLAQSYFNINE